MDEEFLFWDGQTFYQKIGLAWPLAAWRCRRLQDPRRRHRQLWQGCRDPHRERNEMAYLITHFWPGATMSQYDATVAIMHNPWPQGQLYHAARLADGGILIAAVWESKDHFDRFLRGRVMPSMPIDGGLTGQPEQRTAETANLVTA